MMNEQLDIQALRQRLLALQEELLATAGERAESSQAVELDQTRTGRLSRMDALQGQAMALAARQRAEVQLRRIAAALRRIEEGNYGYCQQCEESIDPRRLAVDPTAPLCIHCAQ